MLVVQAQAFDPWCEKNDKAKFTTGKTTAWYRQILESLSNEQKKLFDDEAQTTAWYKQTISSIADVLKEQGKIYEAAALRRVILTAIEQTQAAVSERLAAINEQDEELNKSRPHTSAVLKQTIGAEQTLKFTLTQDESSIDSTFDCVFIVNNFPFGTVESQPTPTWNKLFQYRIDRMYHTNRVNRIAARCYCCCWPVAVI